MKLTNKLTDPPASPKVLNYLLENVFDKSFKNIDIAVIGFPNCGKSAQLKYLIRNLADFRKHKENHLFITLDVEILLENEESAYKAAIESLKLNNKLDKLTKLFEKENGELTDLSTVLHSLSIEKGYNITIFLDNFSKLFPDINQDKLNHIYALKKINPMQISFIIHSAYEVDEVDLKKLDLLADIYIHNTLYFGNKNFDEDSGGLLIRNQESWYKHKFKDKFKEKVIELSKNDPATMKHIVTKGLADKEFEDNFIKESSSENIYELIGKDILNLRYARIIEALKDPSIKCLKNNFENPTEFLTKTGLVINGKPMNKLLEYFIEKNKDNFAEIKSDRAEKSNGKKDIKQLLSGQELLLLQFLEAKNGEMVLRDDVAKVLWGEQWENDYSDWAIDKTVSRLRSKLEENNYSKALKSIKGKGVILS